MTLQICEVIYGGVVSYFCAASDGKGRWFHITLIGYHLESIVIRMPGTHTGTTYSRVVFCIHKTSTRVIVYDVDILDEISGIV